MEDLEILCLSLSGSIRGFSFLWNDFNLDLSLVASSSNWMLALIKSRSSDTKFWLFNVYGPIGILEKLTLWEDLIHISSPLNNSLVILGGDFNAISDLEEKSEGIFPNNKITEDFASFIQNMSLIDRKTQNGPFNWSNMRKDFSQIAERLDHFLVSKNWIESALEFFSLVFPNVGFDHFPILFSIFEDRASHKIPFKFEPMWLWDPTFLPLLREWWLSAPFFEGSRMFHLTKK